jgi:hypothetical protein
MSDGLKAEIQGAEWQYVLQVVVHHPLVQVSLSPVQLIAKIQ